MKTQLAVLALSALCAGPVLAAAPASIEPLTLPLSLPAPKPMPGFYRETRLPAPGGFDRIPLVLPGPQKQFPYRIPTAHLPSPAVDAPLALVAPAPAPAPALKPAAAKATLVRMAQAAERRRVGEKLDEGFDSVQVFLPEEDLERDLGLGR